MDHDTTGEDTGAVRPPRDPAAPAPGRPAPVRTVRLTVGDYLLTVNPIDGSEIERRPPGLDGVPESTETPRRTPAQRAAYERAARPPVPAGPAAPRLPLLGRDDEREHIARMLARGRSLLVTGARGAGRSTLLDAVAADCADLAPDGVIRLNGHHRGPADLLHDLFAAVHHAPLHRPDPDRLRAAVASIGAVVVLDDLEFGSTALDDFLDAAPECAFLLATTPDTAEPPISTRLEEVPLPGLSRTTSLELLRTVVDRPLAEDEINWAGDLWFESDGLPLRFVQAGALLLQRDTVRERLQDDPDSFDAFAPPDGVEGGETALPTLGQSAAPAALLAARLGESARRTLRFAVALGGELPHQAHLPALIGDTHADTAIGELLGCGLLSPAGSGYRLAAGALLQLKEGGYGDDAPARSHTAAQHYTWWTAHPSVAAERIAAEADAVLATLTSLVTSREPGHSSAAVLLARSAAPAFAAGLHWGAWERVLRTGSEAARIAGEVAEEAYFHHELGILALCGGRVDRARTELETSIGMRGALADRIGTVVGRRALALVEDRENGLVPGAPVTPETLAAARSKAGAPALPPRPLALPPGVPAGPPTAPAGGRRGSTQPLPVVSGTVTVAQALPPGKGPRRRPAGGRRRTLALVGARRNLVAASAAVVLAAVVTTLVSLGPAGQDGDGKSGTVREDTSSTGDDRRGGLDSGESAGDSADQPPGTPAGLPGRTRGTGPVPGASGTPSPGASSAPSGTPASPGPSEPGLPGTSAPPPASSAPPLPSGSASPGGQPSPSDVSSSPPASPKPPISPTPPVTAPPVKPTPPTPPGRGENRPGGGPDGSDGRPSTP
ncbi:ATP-binding protein [Streptomyces sp. NPDC000594]|uniref:ATP-binding protein n=1 Tax=Streptomyces sp. NPDC000594 TaxID=3154261 RepID=UPI0033168833